MAEHLQCFPAIGNIIVHSLKVKRRGILYHLSDSMPVKSAFGTKKGNWFVSADASSVEQDNNILHVDKHKVENELALPCVTQKILPFENQIVSNVNGDSCKDASKSLEEDKLSGDKPLAISKDLNSKKRTRDVSDENLLNDPSECGLPAKKKRKTQSVKSNVKASEEKIVLTNVDDNVKDRGVSMNNENTFELKSKDNGVVGEKSFDQVAAAVPLSLEDAGRETVADVAMVAETNIEHGVCEKENGNESVQKAVMENEIPASLTRTSDYEPDAAVLTVVASLKRGSKRSAKHKAAKKEVSSASLIKELHNINTDAIDSSRQDVGFNGQDLRGDQIDKHEKDGEFSLKQEPEVKLSERRKRVKKSAAKIKNETLVTQTRVDDNPVGDVTSTVLDPILDENLVVKNEVLETTLVDDVKKNDEMIVKMEVSEPTKSRRNRTRVENMEENSKNNLKDRSRRRKKDVEETGLKIHEAVVKQPDDVATSVDECARNDDILMNHDVELLRT
ncbi:uncharacterized protein LOC143573065 [Bidens hawaiensis]|uniref:uncharacterized protein LOC143573065 n=1 Tax=Bidens hawaiensis TaxID=980011 RepID=UPI00404B1076